MATPRTSASSRNTMLRIFFTCIFYLMSTLSHADAQGIHFESGFLKQVFEKAKSENKPVFIDVFATWCAPCRYMDEVIFEDPGLGEYVNKHFVSTQLDAEAGEGVALADEYLIEAYPTLLVFSPEGELLGRKEGVLNANELKMWLAMASSKNMPTSKTLKKKAGTKRSQD